MERLTLEAFVVVNKLRSDSSGHPAAVVLDSLQGMCDACGTRLIRRCGLVCGGRFPLSPTSSQIIPPASRLVAQVLCSSVHLVRRRHVMWIYTADLVFATALYLAEVNDNTLSHYGITQALLKEHFQCDEIHKLASEPSGSSIVERLVSLTRLAGPARAVEAADANINE